MFCKFYCKIRFYYLYFVFILIVCYNIFYLLLKHPQKLPVLPFVLLFGNTFALTAIELFDVLQLQEHPLLLLLFGQLVLIVNKSFSTPLRPLLLIVNKFPLSLFEHPPCYR